MTSEALLDLLLQILLSVAAAIPVAIFVAQKAATTVVNVSVQRYLQRRDQEFQQQLEAARDQWAGERAAMSSVLEAFSKGHEYSQQKRIEAIEKLWEEMGKFRSYSSSASLLYMHKNPRADADHLGWGKSIASVASGRGDLVADSFQAIDAHRPFLGEELYRHYLAYVMLAMGTVAEMNDFLQGKSDHLNRKRWSTAEIPKAVLANVSDELRSDREAMSWVEQRILHLMNLVISGQSSSDASLEHARAVLEARRELGAAL